MESVYLIQCHKGIDSGAKMRLASLANKVRISNVAPAPIFMQIKRNKNANTDHPKFGTNLTWTASIYIL